MNNSSIPPEEERMERFFQLCRDHNLKVTHQRLEIYKTFLRTTNHPTAEELYNRLKKRLPTISLDTIYRTLALFEEHGLITRVHGLSDKFRFDPNTELHHHFICTKCKRIYDFYWNEFDQLTLPESVKQFGEVHEEKVELRGICRDCLKQAE